MNIKDSKIYIAGHNGMVGSSLYRVLQSNGYKNLIGLSRDKLNLLNQADVIDFFKTEKPSIVINAAGKVGGINANNLNPYEFLMENLQIQNNLIDSSLKYGVNKFIFIGTSSIYPRLSPQPIKEEYLLTGPFEPTNEGYAIAKIAGIKACNAIKKQFGKDFISLLPSNLYGVNDNFDLETAHVIQALIRKFVEASENNHTTVSLWGSGSPKREFTYVDDFSLAVMFCLENKLDKPVYNVGNGEEISIKDLAILVKEIVGFDGKIVFDKSKPDGIPRKLMDSSNFKSYGWNSSISLKDGIKTTLEWYLKNRT